MAINYELLRKVKAHILEEPKRINMNDWIEKDKERLLRLLQNCGRDETYLPKCGTVACIAGWALQLSKIDTKNFQFDTFVAEGKKLLGLTSEQATSLFFVDEWPVEDREFLEEIEDEWGTEAYARVVADRIDIFIESKGEI